MANVSDDFDGLDLSLIKQRDREQIDEYKKRIQVLEEDNHALELERSTLKRKIHIQAKMYASSDSEPRQRYKGLTLDQLQSVDQYVLHLLDMKDPAMIEDFHHYKRLYEELKQ